MNENTDKNIDFFTTNSEREADSLDITYNRGKHPNSISNLNSYPKGVSGNPNGRPSKIEKLRRSLNKIGDAETFDHNKKSKGTRRRQVLQRIWNEALIGNFKYIQLLGTIGCLDEDGK